MFKDILKKGFIGIETVVIAGVVLTVAGISIPYIMNGIGGQAGNATGIKNGIPNGDPDNETGYVIGSGESIHYGDEEHVIEVPDEPVVIDPDDGKVHVTSIDTDVSNLNMYIGETATITATVSPSNATNKQLAWTSTNRDVVTVSANGKVTAVGVGVADIQITAYDNGVRKTVHVVVREIPSTDIEVNFTYLILREGHSEQLVAKVIPEETTNQNITFSSEDPTIAVVDDDGLVTAVSATPGKNKTNIVVSNGSIKKLIPVEVIADRVYSEGIAVDTNVLNMFVGNVKKINAYVVPTNATNNTLKYDIVDTSIATVDSNGNVTALKEGSTAMYIRNYGADFYGKEVYAAVLINVQNEKVSPESMTLRYPNSHMYPGETQNPIYEIFPSNTSDKSLTWTSSNSAAIVVDENGKITAVSSGVSTITATSKDRPSVKASYVVTVDPPIVHVERVSVDPTFVELEVGDSKKITATITPSNATNKKLNWTVSDETVAAIDSNTQTIIGMKAGRTQVRVEAEDNPDVFALIEVVVEDTPINGITISPRDIVMNKSENIQLTVTFNPTTVTNNSVAWSSDNTSVGTIDNNGLFTAKAYGTVNITAKAINGVSDTITINVKEITPTSINFDKVEYVIQKNKCINYDVSVLPSNAVNKNYTVSIGDGTIASLDTSKKQICGLKVGETKLTATSSRDSNVKTSVVVKVLPIYAEDIIFNPASATLNLDNAETTTIKYTVYPIDAEVPTLEFTSGDSLVATVDSNGKITPVGVGETDIYVSITGEHNVDPEKLPYKFHVKVISEKIEPINLIADEAGVTLVLDTPVQTHKLAYHFEPSNATQTALRWTSDNETIAVVDSKGVVTPIGLGNCKITAETTNAKVPLKITYDITVKTPSVTSFIVIPNEITMSLEDPVRSYSVEILPTTAPQDYNLSYDEEYVRVDKVNKTITALKTGKTTIHFYDYEYSKSVSVEVSIISNSWNGDSDGMDLEIKNGVCYVRQPGELAYLSEVSQTKNLSETCRSVEIMNDLKMGGGFFTPFNFVDVPINGNGYAIQDLYVDVENEATFIRNLSGSLSDLTIENASFRGASTSMIASEFTGTIRNIKVLNNTSIVDNQTNLLVGKASSGLIENVEIIGNNVFKKNSGETHVDPSNESVVGNMGSATLDKVYIEQPNAGSVVRSTITNSAVLNHVGFTSYYKGAKIVQNATYPITVKNSYFVNPTDYTNMLNPANVHFGKENSSGEVYTETVKYNADGSISTSSKPDYTVHANTSMKNSQSFVDVINTQEGNLSWYLNYNKYPNLVAMADRLVDVNLKNNRLTLPVDVTHQYIPEFDAIPSQYYPEEYQCGSSSNNSVATVSGDCEIKTIKAGNVFFSVEFGNGISKTVNLTVEDRIYPTSINIIENQVEIFSGESTNIEYALEPMDVNYAPLTWESSDETIAVVGPDGGVVGIRAGEVTITVSAKDMNGNIIGDTCKVVVKDVYEIAYNLGGGYFSGYVPESYSGKYEVILPVAIKDGYGFMGWKDDSTGEIAESIPVGSTGNKSFTAQWEIYYSITYDADGGTMPRRYPKRYLSSEGLSELPTPVKEGYEFVGWMENVDYDLNEYWGKNDDGNLILNYNNYNNNISFYAPPIYSYYYNSIEFNLSEKGILCFKWYLSDHGGNYGQYQIVKDGEVLLESSELYETSPQTEKIELESGNYEIIFLNADDINATVYIKDFSVLSNISSIPSGTTGDKVLTAQWEKQLTYKLKTGSEFNALIPSTTTDIVFTDEVMPASATLIDVDADGDGGVVAWLDGTTFKISTQVIGQKVIANEDSSYMFCGNSNYGNKLTTTQNILSYQGMNNLDVSNVVNMSFMFEYAGRNATTFSLDLSGWNTSKVTNMSFMFEYAGEYATTWSIGDISGWDTSKVTNMSCMFCQAGYSPTTFTLSGIENWDTSSVTDMSGMFGYAGYSAGTFNLDLSGWNTSSVTNMFGMFGYAGEYATTWSIGDISGWDTSSVTDMSYMFCQAGYSATTFTLSGIENWDTSSVTDMSFMFFFAGYSAGTFNLDLSGWNTSKVTNMSYMFYRAGYSATTFTLSGIENWDTSSVTDMSLMFPFAGYSAGTFNLDLSGWNTSSVTDMSDMFGCAGYSAETFNLDLSGWNTSSVTNMSGMFQYAGANATTWSIGDISGWDTSKVTNMSYMFYRAGRNATNFTTLDLSGWNTSKVTDMSYMFNSFRTLKTIYVGDGWNTSSVNSSSNMFYGCTSLVGQSGTKYDSSKTDKKMANWQTGYLTYKPAGTIYFSIGNRNYFAEEGMTWEQWKNSSYNTDGYMTMGDSVVTNDGMRTVCTRGGDLNSAVNKNDIIIPNSSYFLRGNSHSGGSGN